MAYDLDELKNRLKERVDEVVALLYADCSLKKVGNNLFAGNITGAPSSKGGLGSFCITVSGPKKGYVREFGAGSDQMVSLIDCWMVRRGLEFGEAVREAAQFVELEEISDTDNPILKIRYKENGSGSKPQPKQWTYPQEMLPRSIQAIQNRLARSEFAMDYLSSTRGLTRETIEEFRIGMDYPDKITNLLSYWRSQGKTMPAEPFGNIVFPLRGIDGKFYDYRSYLSVPGMAERYGLEKSELKSWLDGSGLYLTYFSQEYDNQPYLFVCEGPKDLWRTYQALKEYGYERHFLLVSSTAGSAFPLDLDAVNSCYSPPKFRGFFERFKLIVLGQDNDQAGDEMAERWTVQSGRTCLRMRVPLSYNSGKKGADWTDFWNNGGNLEAFRYLFANAPQLSATF